MALMADKDLRAEETAQGQITNLVGEIEKGLTRAKAVTMVNFPARDQGMAKDRLVEAHMFAENKQWAQARQYLALVSMWAHRGITYNGKKP